MNNNRLINLGDERFYLQDVFKHSLTVPDCIVNDPNKIGSARGEKKFYISSKEEMRMFFGGEGFRVKCFVLKQDLISYLVTMKSEYFNPSQAYREAQSLPNYWEERMKTLEMLPDIVEFDMFDQTQIGGPRGYVNTEKRYQGKIVEKGDKLGYRLITEIALPLVSYCSIMRLTTPSGSEVFYWKLFPDFDAISEIKNGALVLKYGKKATQQDEKEEEGKPKQETEKIKTIRQAREGQGKYREQLLEECWFCPFTRISETELLIASHIKPWAVSNDIEKIDPKNGFAFTPMFDKLFDRGYISFTDDKHLMLSKWFSQKTFKTIGISENQYIQDLQLDDKRREYLNYHRDYIFKG